MLLILPLLSETELYGEIALLIAVENVLYPILTKGQHVVVLRYFHRTKYHESVFFKSIIGNLLRWWLLLIPLIVLLFFMIYRVDFYRYSALLVILPFLVIKEVFLNKYRIIEKINRYAVIRVSYAVSKFLFVLGLTYILSDAFSYIIAIALAVVLAVLLVFWYEKNLLKAVFAKAENKAMSSVFGKFGLPLVFHFLSAGILIYIDRFMIEAYLGKSAVGIYSFSYSIGYSLFFLIYIGNLVYQPIIFKIDKNITKARRSLKIYTGVTFLFISVPLVLLIAAYPYLNRVYNEAYTDTFQTFVFIALALYVYPLYNQGNLLVTLMKKTALLPLASGVAALVNIAFNLILIKKYGIEGAAMATLLANVALVWSINFFSKHRPVNFIFILFVSVLALAHWVLYLALNRSFHYALIGAICIFSIFIVVSEFKSIKIAESK